MSDAVLQVSDKTFDSSPPVSDPCPGGSGRNGAAPAAWYPVVEEIGQAVPGKVRSRGGRGRNQRIATHTGSKFPASTSSRGKIVEQIVGVGKPHHVDPRQRSRCLARDRLHARLLLARGPFTVGCRSAGTRRSSSSARSDAPPKSPAWIDAAMVAIFAVFSNASSDRRAPLLREHVPQLQRCGVWPVISGTRARRRGSRALLRRGVPSRDRPAPTSCSRQHDLTV